VGGVGAFFGGLQSAREVGAMVRLAIEGDGYDMCALESRVWRCGVGGAVKCSRHA
jgi:hypothetical protein